jgi:hypothetical protein
MRSEGSATIVVGAPARAVYELVADVTNVGALSPECRSAQWVGEPAAPVPGARFRGRNVARRVVRWSRLCEILVADPGREFAFRTIPTLTKPDSTVWRYRFEPADGGTAVTESYEIVKMPPRLLVALIQRVLPHHVDMRPHLERTLEALKRAAETGTGAPRSA